MDDLKRDLSMARQQLHDLAAGVQRLEGTFASIETHMVRLFEQRIEDKKRFEAIERRLDSLEQNKP